MWKIFLWIFNILLAPISFDLREKDSWNNTSGRIKKQIHIHIPIYCTKFVRWLRKVSMKKRTKTKPTTTVKNMIRIIISVEWGVKKELTEHYSVGGRGMGNSEKKILIKWRRRRKMEEKNNKIMFLCMLFLNIFSRARLFIVHLKMINRTEIHNVFS